MAAGILWSWLGRITTVRHYNLLRPYFLNYHRQTWKYLPAREVPRHQSTYNRASVFFFINTKISFSRNEGETYLIPRSKVGWMDR